MNKNIYILTVLFIISANSCNKPLTNDIIPTKEINASPYKIETTPSPSIISKTPSAYTQETPNPENSSYIFSKVEKLQTIPENPCVGDSVTIKGINFQNAKKAILFMNTIEPNPSPSLEPLYKSTFFFPNDATSIKLGTTTIDNDGSFNISFELKEKMGPIENGTYKIIENNKEYNFYVQYGNNLETSGYKFFSIKTCIK